MKRDYTKLLLGLIITVIGLSLLFNQFNIAIFGITFEQLLSYLWPLIFIIIGLSIWFGAKSQAGIVITAIGLLFFLNVIFDISIWSILWPVIIIIIGLSILFKGSSKSTGNKSSDNHITVNSIFTGIEKQVNSKNFQGSNIFTMFGGTELDLTKAQIDKDGADIDITVLFGGVTIIVPKDVIIRSEGSALLGGWEEKVDAAPNEKSPVLRIGGTAIFGGVEIK